MSSSVFKIKSVILGGPEGFKTRLLRNISESHFQRCYKNAVGVDIGVKKLMVNNKNIILSLWDCLCQQRAKILRMGFYKGSDGAIICFDSSTLNDIKAYLKELHQSSKRKLPILYVYIKEGEQISRNFIKEDRNVIRFVNIHEALSWFAQNMVNYQDINETGYLEINLHDLAEVSFPPDISFDISHPEKLKPIIKKMGFLVSDDEFVYILKEKSLFSVNLLNASVKMYPLICESCKNQCKKEKNICIILDSKGWSSIPDLSQKDLLILSKIYALANISYEDENFPKNIRNQIKKVLVCSKFTKK
ncbi:MAG: hypothetical protein ACTSRG_02550 [Candidatus Helarchaeota archaeon]